LLTILYIIQINCFYPQLLDSAKDAAKTNNTEAAKDILNELNVSDEAL
jgi:hypothetical protein